MELLIAGGVYQNYPPGLIGQSTCISLDEVDHRCRHFSWLVLETKRLGNDGWLAKYGDAFTVRKNAAFAYYARIYSQYVDFTTQPHHTLDSLILANGAELQRRFETYFDDKKSPYLCAATLGTWRSECQCDPFTQHEGWPFVTPATQPIKPRTQPGPGDPIGLPDNGLMKKLLIVAVILALMKYILS
jgi:hypothetical protein